ncbi:hypothetical protein ABK040_012948 [Willaertia magna]
MTLLTSVPITSEQVNDISSSNLDKYISFIEDEIILLELNHLNISILYPINLNLEDCKIFITTKHFYFIYPNFIYKIYFGDILIHAIQGNNSIYCQLNVNKEEDLPTKEEEIIEEDDNDEDYEDIDEEIVCEMTICVNNDKITSNEKSIEMIKLIYDNFSKAASTIEDYNEEEESMEDQQRFNEISNMLDEKLMINLDGFIYNVEEVRRNNLIRKDRDNDNNEENTEPEDKVLKQ